MGSLVQPQKNSLTKNILGLGGPGVPRMWVLLRRIIGQNRPWPDRIARAVYYRVSSTFDFLSITLGPFIFDVALDRVDVANWLKMTFMSALGHN